MIAPIRPDRATWRKRLANRAARRYVAGPGPAHALDRSLALSRNGVASTIGYWNGGGEPPRRVVESYLTTANLVAAARLDCYLSLKAPALGFDERLARAVAERCRQHGIGLHFDALGPDVAARTLVFCARLRPEIPALGCTLPGRWRRSLSDAELAIRLGLRVRVVKGEWEAAPGDAVDPGEGFLEIIDRLAGRSPHVAVATHDWRLAREALARLRATSTSASLELLLGVPVRRVLGVAATAGVPVRMYVPYGRTRLPYRVTQATTRPQIAWWFLRDLVR